MKLISIKHFRNHTISPIRIPGASDRRTMSGKNFRDANYNTPQGTDRAMKESILKDVKDSNFQVGQQHMGGHFSVESPKINTQKLRGYVGSGDGDVNGAFVNHHRDGTVSNLIMSGRMESTL